MNHQLIIIYIHARALIIIITPPPRASLYGTVRYAEVTLVSITGAGRDQLEVVGEDIDIPCLVNSLRKKVCRSAGIVVVEEVKDKAKVEEEKKKKEEEEKKKKAKELQEAIQKHCPPPPFYGGPPFLCEEQTTGCHIM
jgi:hypothetical protein